MPDKPDTWAAAAAWLQHHWPALYGAALAGFIAALRVIYDRGSKRQIVLECALCGALTLAVSSALEWAAMPLGIAPFFGGAIGLVGVEGVRHLAKTYFGAKAGRS